MCVCVSVCPSVRQRISGTVDRSLLNFVCGFPVAVARSSSGCVALVCTSGFMDDVTFDRNGREAGKGWQHSASAIKYVRVGVRVAE